MIKMISLIIIILFALFKNTRSLHNVIQIANKCKGHLLMIDNTDGNKHTLIDMNQRKTLYNLSKYTIATKTSQSM